MATVTKPIALDESLNTTELSSRNVADVLAQELSAVATAIGGISAPSAEDVSYDNSGSGLSATDVQNALDEIVSDIPTVNDGTLTIQQNGETKGTFTANQSGNSTVNIETPTTDIQTAVDEFETYNGGLLSSCKVALSPNQDLHGYDHPWVGGAGKNKWAFGDFTGGYSNVPFSLPAGTYTISKSDNNVVSIRFMGGSMNIPVSFTSSTTVTLTEATTSINYYSGDGTATNVMIESGSTATAYEPYENICPISGHTQVEVENHQKNLCDDSLIVQGDIDNSTGADTADGSLKHIRSGYCNAESSTQYTVSHNHTIGSGTLKVFEYRSDKSFIRRTNAGAVTSLSYTFTTHSECKYIRIAIYDESGISKDSTWIQLELGSTATAYVPYNGYQVTVNLGGTYYSGTLDIVSGVFTLTHVMWSDDGSKNWARNADGSFYVFYTDTHPLAVQDAGGCSCDYAPFVLSFDGMSVFARANGLVSLGRGWGNIYPDAASLKAQFAIEPFQMVYKLASPQSIQLSPTMVKALVGENHLSAPLDGQEITESKYRQMFTFDDVNAQIESTYSEGISHNSVYRGKYLGDHVTDEQWDAIGDGSFRDLYIGDYWTINGINWRIAHFNYWLGTGDVKCNTNHVVIVPYGWVSTFNMNASDDTTGGYLNSEWYTTNRHFAVENIEADFGASHILSHRNFFSDAVSDGHASHGMWVDSTVDLMNEIMVCGSLVGSYLGKYYEVGCDKFQLALFKYNPPSARMDVSYWLRGVSTASSFVAMGNFGLLDGFTASQILKIRPVFAIKK